MPRILIVDDSATARLLLRHAFSLESDFEIVGEAANGPDALALIAKLKPDLVTLDVYLQKENGIELTKQIMAKQALPILIITGVNPDSADLAFSALAAGALGIRGKLPAPATPEFENERRRLTRLARALSTVPVVTRKAKVSEATREPASAAKRHDAATPTLDPNIEMVLIGASTGGPPLLSKLLAAVPPPLPVPMAIVQHIAEGFGAGLADWLRQTSKHDVQICHRTTLMKAGTIYLPPDGLHLQVLNRNSLTVSDEPPLNFQRPAIDRLFESAANEKVAALGILLTGMGDDGARGLLALHTAGNRTVAQAPESCAIDSMPRRAIALGAASDILKPEQISDLLTKLRRRSNPSPTFARGART